MIVLGLLVLVLCLPDLIALCVLVAAALGLYEP
jgi:hypothetical protein